MWAFKSVFFRSDRPLPKERYVTPTNDFQTHLHVNGDVIGRPPDLAQPDRSGSVTRRYRPLSTVPLLTILKLKSRRSFNRIGVTEMVITKESSITGTSQVAIKGRPRTRYVAAGSKSRPGPCQIRKTSDCALWRSAIYQNNRPDPKYASAMETAVKVQNVPWPPVMLSDVTPTEVFRVLH